MAKKKPAVKAAPVESATVGWTAGTPQHEIALHVDAARANGEPTEKRFGFTVPVREDGSIALPPPLIDFLRSRPA